MITGMIALSTCCNRAITFDGKCTGCLNFGVDYIKVERLEPYVYKNFDIYHYVEGKESFQAVHIENRSVVYHANTREEIELRVTSYYCPTRLSWR